MRNRDRPANDWRLLLLGAILLTFLGAPLVPPARAGFAAAPATATPSAASYTVEATLDVGAARLGARQVVRTRNDVGVPLETVVFRAVPATVAGFTLESAAVDGQSRPARLEGSILEVPLAAPLAPGGSAEVELRFAIRLPREPGRLSATGRAVALGNWVPLLTVHRGDWDRRQYVDVGDAFFSEVADYDVTLATSRPLVIAATGQLVERDGNRWRFQASGVRDFALTAASYAVQQVDAGPTPVLGYALSGAKAALYAERGARFVRWFGDRYGAYPYPALAIAEVDLPASYGGMEFPGLIMLAGRLGAGGAPIGGDLDVLIGHEIAHQWFYSWVGNDQIADPWLDEAFATYLPILYYGDQRPDLYQTILDRGIAGAGAGGVDRSVYDFASDSAYYTSVYRAGARFLHELRGQLGDAAFTELVRAHVATFRDRVATPRAFLDLAQSGSRADLNPLFARYFSYGAFQYPASPSWTLEVPAIPWRGSVALFVGADFPVTRVELWLDGRPLARGPENAVTVDLTGVPPGEYVLLARVWNHDGAIFERARRVEVGA